MNWSAVAGSLRLPLGFAFGILYLAFARPTPLTLVVGVAIALAGLAMRAWAAGHIIKNDRLATSGPYAHTRNPLYFGSFLIAAGFAIAAHWSLLLLVIALFALIYGPTMEREADRVGKAFPDSYPQWASNVPGFVPRATPWRSGTAGESAQPFSFDLYMRHGEWRAALVFVLVVAWLIIRMRLGL